jgi:hypothetical protein
MLNDKRKGDKLAPELLYKLLNKEQFESLRELAKFGWEVCFVRMPLFQLRTVALRNAAANKYAILAEDGRLDTESDLKVRG